MNIENGALFRYNQSVSIYKCPADKSTVRDQGQIPRTRTVSMSIYMNAITNPGDSDYRKCWHKTSQILKPGPARALVFMEH